MNVHIKSAITDRVAEIGWVDAKKIPALVSLIRCTPVWDGEDTSVPDDVWCQVVMDDDGNAVYEIIVETDG